MPPPQQQHHYLINNHIIKQSSNYKNSTLWCYSALPMTMTNVSTVYAINLSPQRTSLKQSAPSNNAASTAAASLFDSQSHNKAERQFKIQRSGSYDDPPADNNCCYITIANNLQQQSSSTWSTEPPKDAAASTAPSLMLHHRRTAEPQRSIFSTTLRLPMQTMLSYFTITNATYHH